jgi:predicted nucleotidyltransferase
MRATHTVDEILGTRSRVKVLRVLRGVRIPLNASQIAARTGLSRPAVAATLEEFAAMGLVGSTSAGQANVHLLVRENVYVDEIVEPLFAAEERIPGILLDALRSAFGEAAGSVVLFGSYARGDQTAESDVDVVLVARDAGSKQELEARVDDYGYAFRKRFGATLSALVYDAAEAASLAATAPTLADSIQCDALVVSGVHPRDWARNVRPAPRSGARTSLAKSHEFSSAAIASLADSRWDAAGLTAIHSGICSADAALIASAGVRSTSGDHGAVLGLLEEQVPEFTATRRRQLGGLLKMKNKVAYEQRPLTEAEARQLVDHASRLGAWARTVVEAHLPE